MVSNPVGIKIEELFSLKDRVTVISGIGGIGEMLAKAFGANGAKLILTDVNVNALTQIKARLSEAGIASQTYPMDVTSKLSIQEVFDKVIDTYGRMDVLIVTSGVAKSDRAVDFNEEDIDRILQVNLKGTILCDQVAGKIMSRQK
ncbi:MAG: SDR family oxidoreductase, partial [Deltaproteobacteria bacterium]|nr:SDR family oxidoreductase [Deltaproteobacteria bacterium]